MNARGEAVGTALLSGVPIVGVVWRGHTGVALPGLGGTLTRASGINARSWIVGSAQLAPPTSFEPNMHAALWIGGQAHDLNALTVDRPAEVVLISAEDVNDGGQIVGYAEVGGVQRPFLLTPAGG
ncbi:MAG TPA: hypothetical protein VFF36_18160 [Planctomycetota bacterium]|nr:hypothetical protein [Planctomycetota bacterium]